LWLVRSHFDFVPPQAQKGGFPSGAENGFIPSKGVKGFTTAKQVFLSFSVAAYLPDNRGITAENALKAR